MVADLDLGIEIVGLPTVREPDGLALSSRNVRLTPDDRAAAVAHPAGVGRCRSAAPRRRSATPPCSAAAALRVLAAEPRARLEYVELVDAATLEPSIAPTAHVVVLIAAWFGDVRLIDNAVLGR